MPFSLYMPGLFESFVARWLSAHLPARFKIDPQIRADIEGSDGLHFRIDLVLEDRATGRVLGVLDTKYKDAARPSQSDIQQIVAYAARMRIDQAVLIYPSSIEPRRFSVGDVWVHLLGFDISRPPGVTGPEFLAALRDVGLISRREPGMEYYRE